MPLSARIWHAEAAASASELHSDPTGRLAVGYGTEASRSWISRRRRLCGLQQSSEMSQASWRWSNMDRLSHWKQSLAWLSDFCRDPGLPPSHANRVGLVGSHTLTVGDRVSKHQKCK